MKCYATFMSRQPLACSATPTPWSLLEILLSSQITKLQIPRCPYTSKPTLTPSIMTMMGPITILVHMNELSAHSDYREGNKSLLLSPPLHELSAHVRAIDRGTSYPK